MIKVKVIENFSFGRYNEVENIIKVNGKGISNYFEKGDIFDCQKDIADYLIKTNKFGKPFVQIIEVIPDKKTKKEADTKSVDDEKPKRTRKTKIDK